MTLKESNEKLYIASQVCYWAHVTFQVIHDLQKKQKSKIVKDELPEKLFDMTLRDIARLLDTLKGTEGGSIPDNCRSIL